VSGIGATYLMLNSFWYILFKSNGNGGSYAPASSRDRGGVMYFGVRKSTSRCNVMMAYL
jgi:hypothetical protein